MKKFHFPMDTLLKVQRQRVKIVKKDLFDAENSVSSLDVLQKRAEDELKTVQGEKKFDFRRYRFLIEELQKIQKEKEKASKEIAKKKEKALVVFLSKKNIEKMREKSYTLWHEKGQDP